MCRDGLCWNLVVHAFKWLHTLTEASLDQALTAAL